MKPSEKRVLDLARDLYKIYTKEHSLTEDEAMDRAHAVTESLMQAVAVMDGKDPLDEAIDSADQPRYMN